jgi:hypothetical protein
MSTSEISFQRPTWPLAKEKMKTAQWARDSIKVDNRPISVIRTDLLNFLLANDMHYSADSKLAD